MSNKKIDYASEVEMLLNSRRINRFMATYLLGIASGGLDEDLWQEGIDDAVIATEIGVDNEEEFYVFFYIDHFVEDLVEEIFNIKLDNDEEEQLKKFLFSIRKEVDFFDLLSFRVAILNWVEKGKENKKEAHPNSGRGFAPIKKYDLESWHGLVHKISRDQFHGIPKAVALQAAAATLEVPEKFDFLSWYNITHVRPYKKQYDVNQQIKELNRRASDMTDFKKEATVINDKKYYYVPKIPTSEDKPRRAKSLYTEQHVQDFESLRSKVMGRVFSIDKLLEKYRKVLDEGQLDAIEDALTELRKRVRKLKLASSVRDSLIKTANVVRTQQADDIADALIAIAQEPEAEVEEEEVLEEEGDIPAPATELTPEQRTVVINDVVEQLESISTVIKSREIVRALSRVDILLNKLYMDTFFPELSDAQAKLIEAYSYASNKVEDIIPKIKGAGSDGEHTKVPELSEESKNLASEVSELSENLVEQDKADKEVEEVEEEAPATPEAPAKPAEPVAPKAPAPAAPAAPAPAVEVEEEEGDLLRPVPGV